MADPKRAADLGEGETACGRLTKEAENRDHPLGWRRWGLTASSSCGYIACHISDVYIEYSISATPQEFEPYVPILMTGIHRLRPGADEIRIASGDPAIALDDDIWMSPGISNAYAVATEDGRVLVNTGMSIEAPLRVKAFAAVPGPTHTIIVTQGHPDHWGGVNALRDDSTDVVMHANYRYWRDDNDRLAGYRAAKTSFAFQTITDALMEHLATVDLSTVDLKFPEPTTIVDHALEFKIGGRVFELAWTPGGETTDSLVVWLPQERVLFTGNLFGPLFGHVPNLMTIRGDRYRDPALYVESLNKVLSYGAERLITGHFEPIDGADLIAEEVTAMRDAMQSVHDQVIEHMVAGHDLYTAMQKVTVPGHLDVGEAYGKTSWNTRAIWEMYAGWFQHRSTTELYGVAPSSVSADIVAAAGADALVDAARAHLDVGRHVHALSLTDMVLAADASHHGAKKVAAAAHEALLASASNFWERAWLTKKINDLGTIA
jgi:alkyl sulfatase BDS1-like metallo-beta-lactamase superfamily hydrolase